MHMAEVPDAHFAELDQDPVAGTALVALGEHHAEADDEESRHDGPHADVAEGPQTQIVVRRQQGKKRQVIKHGWSSQVREQVRPRPFRGPAMATTCTTLRSAGVRVRFRLRIPSCDSGP